MEFRDYLVKRFAPVVAVLGSPETEASCQDLTGQSLATFLQPLACLRRLNAPVRTVGEQSYRVKDFQLRFYNAVDMQQPSYDAAQAQLQSVLTQAAASQKDEHADSLPKALKEGKLPRYTPWFNCFKEEFIKQLAFSDLETIDHPVACLMIVDAGLDDPLSAFQQLLKQSSRPPVLKHGSTDGRVLRHFLLISFSDDNVRHQSKLNALKNAFGEQNCQLLNVIREPITATADGRLSEASVEASRSRVVIDPDTAAAFFEQLCGRALLPHLEIQVRTLYQQVMASRKGVRNQLKNFLWRTKSTTEVQSKPRAEVQRWLETVEGQLRSLADLAYLMQDYDLSITTLKSLGTDLKSNKDWQHYGAVQEMLAVASFMAGLPPSEVISFFKDAFYRYDLAAGKADLEIRRFATRSQLHLADYCCSRRMYGEANAALMRAQSQEGNMVAAVLLEQAAMHLLHMDPPAMRKWAFHLVLAALRFSNCSQAQLADAAYRQVVSVFEGQDWEHINAHLQDMLGRHALNQQDYGSAATHFAGALGIRGNHPSRQQQLLNSYFSCMRKLSKEALEEQASSVPLPVILSQQAQVNCDSLLTYANNQARAIAAGSWLEFAAPLNTGQEESQTGGPGTSSGGASYVAVVGEEITLDVDLYNPLALQLQLDHLRVSTECSTANDLQVEEQEVTLRGKEKVRMRLKFWGMRDCKCDIKGISWRLEGLVPGYRALEIRRFPQPRSRGTKKKQESASSVSFQIVSAMPHLQAWRPEHFVLHSMLWLSTSLYLADGTAFSVHFDHLPSSMAAGEMVICTARLKNTGAATLTSLRMLSSHPDFLCLSNQQLLDQRPDSVIGFPAMQAAVGGMEVESKRVKGGKHKYTWPADCRLEPGQTLDWPFLLRLSEEGQTILNCVWQYEANPPQPGMPHRLLNWSHAVQVSPSFAVKARLLPTAKDVQRFLLQMQFAASEETDSIEIEHIVSTSHNWRVAPLTAGLPKDHKDVPKFERHMLPQGAALNYVGSAWPAFGTEATGCWSTVADADMTALNGTQQDGTPRLLIDDDERDQSGVFGSLAHFIRPQHALDDRESSGQEAKSALDSKKVVPRVQQDDAGEVLGLLVGWRIPGSSRSRLGLTQLQCSTPQAEIRLRASWTGQSNYSWDFSKGPLQVDLKLLLCHFYHQSASICCETGVNLQLDSSRQQGGRQWKPRTTAEKPMKVSEEDPSLSRSTSAAESLETLVVARPAFVGPQCLPSVVWTGQTQTRIPQVPQGKVEEVPLQVQVFRPGRFVISDYAVYWTFPDGVLNAVKSGPQILLNVQQIVTE